MHILAFDVSRDTADGVLVSRALKIKDRYQLPNTKEALLPVLTTLQKQHRLLVGVESTGLFHMPVVEACTQLDIPCKLLNPILTKEILKASIRKRKTDREDAIAIAKLLLQGEGSLITIDQITDERKILVRSANKPPTRPYEPDHACTDRRETHRQYTRSSRREHCCAHQGARRAATGSSRCIRQRTERYSTGSPGIGAWLATVLLAEIGDASRFPSGDALDCLCGTRSTYQSQWCHAASHGKVNQAWFVTPAMGTVLCGKHCSHAG